MLHPRSQTLLQIPWYAPPISALEEVGLPCINRCTTSQGCEGLAMNFPAMKIFRAMVFVRLLIASLNTTIALAQSDCNHNCELAGGIIVEICLLRPGDEKFFESCCPRCAWIYFGNNESQLGESFMWRFIRYPYGQYNCVNLDGVISKRVLVIPHSKSGTTYSRLVI